MNRLRVIKGAELPMLAYAHPASHDLALVQPGRFRPVVEGPYIGKPIRCGLYTSPVTATDRAGRPAETAWTRFVAESLDAEDLERWGVLTAIVPAENARVALVEDRNDLVALVDAYPDGFCPAWHRIADDFDAVYVLGQNLGLLQRASAYPRLDYFDAATVLFLRPRYMVGSSVPAAEVVAR